MNIRAICTDIDGTLLDSRRELSPRTIQAIQFIKDEMPVILASSRMPSAMRHLQRVLGILDHPLICFNGGYVIRYKTGHDIPEVLDSVTIPVSVFEYILNAVKGTGIHVSLYHEDNWYAPQEDQWTAREAKVTKVLPAITPFTGVLEKWRCAETGAHKVMCMGLEEELNVLEATLNATQASELHVYRSKSTYIEIAPRAISKASALADVLRVYYNLDIKQSMAFGDNYNDIDMLRAAGSGVAVANARDEVKAVAGHITAKNTEDGVAQMLEQYVIAALRNNA
ncbi:MAG TPA: Cof-type HAD-IIB family hydrolase [Ohtaekwangia sp.]|uniref:Cof-type HAD-IIB family hydrolase n=1 Tax=Ohtaekwangia sp. TaxID=2066019 RepID=UPI002F9246CD